MDLSQVFQELGKVHLYKKKEKKKDLGYLICHCIVFLSYVFKIEEISNLISTVHGYLKIKFSLKIQAGDNVVVCPARN